MLPNVGLECPKNLCFPIINSLITFSRHVRFFAKCLSPITAELTNGKVSLDRSWLRIGLLSQGFVSSSRVNGPGRFTPGIFTAEINSSTHYS